MSRRRRGLLLAGLALALGGLAASDVARREAAVARRLSPAVPVVVARADLERGHRVRAEDLAIRRIPLRYAPPGAAAAPEELAGARLAVPVAAGGFLSADHVAAPEAPPGAPVRRGERAVEVVAAGAPGAVTPGARVDVLVTREQSGSGATELALQDVEVLAASAVAGREDAGPRVAATLRVTVRQAVFLTAAQSFAREIRLLPRAAGDRGRSGGLRVGADLR